MLASSASETDGKIAKVAFQIFADGGSDQLLCCFEELLDFWFVVEKFDYRSVFPSIAFVLGVAAGIGQCAAVEYISASIAGGVLGDAFFVGEAVDSDLQANVAG